MEDVGRQNVQKFFLTKLGSKHEDAFCFCEHCLYLERSPTFMGSQKRGEGGCLAENTGTSTLSWWDIFVYFSRKFVSLPNWTLTICQKQQLQKFCSNINLQKIIHNEDLQKCCLHWQFAKKLLTRTSTYKSVVRNFNSLKCGLDQQIANAKASSWMMIYNNNKIDRKGKFVKLLSRMTINKNVVRDETLQKCCPEQKFANFMTKYDLQKQFASILSRKTICKECFLKIWKSRTTICK